MTIELSPDRPFRRLRLLDAMAVAVGQRGHELGFDAPHELLRAVEGIASEVELVMELAPAPRVRPDPPADPARGRWRPHVRLRPHLGVEAVCLARRGT
jgi:hypothetical protein